jgi:hypothetical protein
MSTNKRDGFIKRSPGVFFLAIFEKMEFNSRKAQSSV